MSLWAFKSLKDPKFVICYLAQGSKICYLLSRNKTEKNSFEILARVPDSQQYKTAQQHPMQTGFSLRKWAIQDSHASKLGAGQNPFGQSFPT